jgi:kynurenine formamidase
LAPNAFPFVLPSLSSNHITSYIHGGYYRDPKITASSFHRTLSFLLSSPLYAHIASLIAGFASINYRLSAHPDYPQDPDKLPNYELRHAKHPDHIDDVLTAIGVLQKKYGFGERYLLVGHSVGATMAFQVALSQKVPWIPSMGASAEGETECRVEPPIAILGVEGIYDFPLIVKTVAPEVRDKYVKLTQGAFGKDEEVWLEASPAQYSAEAYTRNWGGGRHWVIVAHSGEDELVDWEQVRAIEEVFSESVEGDRIKFEVVELKGKHHEVWEKGHELARAIAEAIRRLKIMSNAEPRRGSGVGVMKVIG